MNETSEPIVIGIPACARVIDRHLRHWAPARYAEALLACADALPVMIPPIGAPALALLDRLDGLLLSGSPSNVAPELYGAEEDRTPERHDPARDATTLPLLRAALARGMPLLAICRGIQELNVALGGSLHQQLQTVPGRMDHRAGPGTPEAQYAPRHAIALSGGLAALLGAREIMVNSLHEQGIDRLAEGLSVEALAPDGTVEAVRVADAIGFAYGVQWHPEWQAVANPHSRALFAAFAAACRHYAERRRG